MDDEISPARLWGWICAAIGIVLVISVGIWWFNVHTSGIRGAAAVTVQNNAASNRTQAQDEFNQLWGDIKAYNGDISDAATQVAQDETTNADSTFDRSVLAADEATCRKAVQKYNADTKDMTLKDWRPAEDPATIDPKAECEVSS